MKKLIALLLVLMMAVSLIACGNTQSEGDTTGAADTTEAAESQNYVWDVTVVYDGYDALAGEIPPVVTLTENANAANTASVDPAAALAAIPEPEDPEEEKDISSLLDEDNNLMLSVELNASSAAFNEADWTVSDNDTGSTFSYEVVTPLTEGDYETHGELVVVAKAMDYTWNVTVVFGEGAEGTYEITNPGLEGWGAPYESQKNTVTPDDTTFELKIFNHSNWIVDNTASWYQWVIFDVDDVCPEYSFEVTKPLTLGDRKTPGELTINIYIP